MSYSPVLAIATAAFEICAAVWVLTGPGRRRILLLTSIVLLLLAAYQLVEVAICARVPALGFLPRLAFIVVTGLPPMGILLVAMLSRRSRAAFALSFVMLTLALSALVWISADHGFVTRSVCNVVYAKYATPPLRFQFYAYYYWLGLFGMVMLSGIGAIRSSSPIQRRQLLWIFFGSVGFIVPSIIVTQFVAPARGALPSIMCHFALTFAVCLTCMVGVERRAARSESPSG
jgi:hypothetical protein